MKPPQTSGLVAACLTSLLVALPGFAEEMTHHPAPQAHESMHHGQHAPGSHHAHHAAPDANASDDAETGGEVAGNITLLDLDLVDQNGRSVRFKSDVVQDRLVVMNFVFTTCPSVCPVQSAIFARLQKELGDRVGRDVFLVSVSIDPKTDVPRRLREYAARYKAGPGWIWLTGDKKKVDQVLYGVGAYSRDFAEHPAMILVGDGVHGGWTRFYGFPKPATLLARLDELSAARLEHESDRVAGAAASGRGH